MWLRKYRSGKSHGYREAIVFEKLRFQNVLCQRENEKPALSNSSGLKSVFEKLRFRDGLVWMVGQAAVLNFSGVLWTEPKLLFYLYPAAQRVNNPSIILRLSLACFVHLVMFGE